MAWAGRGLHGRRGGGRNRAYDLPGQMLRVRRILFLLCRQLAAIWRSLLHNLQVAKESKKYWRKILQKILQKILKTRRQEKKLL